MFDEVIVVVFCVEVGLNYLFYGCVVVYGFRVWCGSGNMLCKINKVNM